MSGTTSSVHAGTEPHGGRREPGAWHPPRAPDAHLQVYLDEYVFRHNRRRTSMASFQTLLGLSTQHEPITRRDFIDRAA
jgi:hypothetical protein